MFLRGQCLDFVHIYSQKLLSLAWDIFYMSQNEWTTRAGYTRILCYPQNTMTFESFMDKSRKTKTRRCMKTSPNNYATITNAIMDIFKGHTFPFFLFLSIQTLTKNRVILTWRMFILFQRLQTTSRFWKSTICPWAGLHIEDMHVGGWLQSKLKMTTL